MYRGTGTIDTALLDWIREVEARLNNLEAAGPIKGNISLAAQHRLLDVQVSIVDIGGGHRRIDWTSPAGVTATIATL